MDCEKLFGAKGFDMFSAGLTVVALIMIWLVMKPAPPKTTMVSHMSGLPSPGLGLGTSNVMGFYQGFDQLWGPGSSSYSAPDETYLQVMHEFDPNDPAFADMTM